MSRDAELAILGAGPYGLAAAAHVKGLGADAIVFGRTMEFWRQQMPVGMFLRSAWEASHIAHPENALTLDEYRRAHEPDLAYPIPIDAFVRYAEWFQRQTVPNVDARNVERIERASRGFRLVLEDGAHLRVDRVVVAAGLAPFARKPEAFHGLSPELASHSAEHVDFASFADRHVVVVGGGQSALESAALLHEAGATVEVLVRALGLHWLPAPRMTGRWSGIRRTLYRPAVRRALHPSTDVGPLGLNWIVAVPPLFRAFPGAAQRRIARRCIRPAGAAWLPERLETVPITLGRRVVSAADRNDRLELELDDGTRRNADHALLATGFQIDVRRYPFLAPDVARDLRTVDGHPALSRGFESSVPGLHFVGAASAISFGPVMRFVSGTRFTGQSLASTLGRERTTIRRKGATPRTEKADVARSA